MRQTAKQLIPPRYHSLAKSLAELPARFMLRGNDVECPVCHSTFKRFLSGFRDDRPNAHCPRCGSSERHRLLWLYLNREGLLSGDIRLLHIAPERFFARAFERSPSIDYVSGDLDGHGHMRIDVTAIPFPDKSFDAVICSHVLEHVPEDRKALSEIRRVLRGWGVLQVPIQGATTFEDLSITTPAERLANFGQEDHVRIYGWDYLDRLRDAGLVASVVNYAADLSEAERLRYCLDSEPIILVR